MRKVVIARAISHGIGACGLTRAGLLIILNCVYFDLANQYDTYRVHRDKEEPRFFRYPVTFTDGGLIHWFAFLVDDSTSPDHLFVDGLDHHSTSI